MNISSKHHRKLNSAITRRVIELHSKGYDQDFMMQTNRLLCIQNNEDFAASAVQIRVVDQGYDHVDGCFKYIHTIDTFNGQKGVLIADGIFTNAVIH
ncbi:hypothetical protein D0C36_19710 [Mucilaginibacter conchicola]|uniref:Phosphoribosylpyrophosphate synthetase n=1 Tax=Mucilaginibacter conchicola TaxID=2303333 RepID=A0A372NQG3_9SPHI|nr:hypothetical protein [Mucilaginibacter conchicola]RFZ91169.1 hypothetical protein D0C36_19710 [Mucilaginibacter conchicola]